MDLRILYQKKWNETDERVRISDLREYKNFFGKRLSNVEENKDLRFEI